MEKYDNKNRRIIKDGAIIDGKKVFYVWVTDNYDIHFSTARSSDRFNDTPILEDTRGEEDTYRVNTDVLKDVLNSYVRGQLNLGGAL